MEFIKTLNYLSTDGIETTSKDKNKENSMVGSVRK